jgi:hypothetical protein
MGGSPSISINGGGTNPRDFRCEAFYTGRRFPAVCHRKSFRFRLGILRQRPTFAVKLFSLVAVATLSGDSMRKRSHRNIVLFLTVSFWLASYTLCAGRADAQELKFANLGALNLESGEDLKDCRLGYRTFGKLNEKRNNAIVMLTWFNGKTRDMAGAVGADKLIDPGQYFVVLIDALGNGVSTWPSNSPTQPKGKFPHITMRDMVAAEYLLLTKELQLAHVHAVIGESMGAMQTFQWASYPTFMDEPIPLMGTPQQSSYDLLQWNLQPKRSNTTCNTAMSSTLWMTQ